ncbi:alpha/beta hydrolase [Sporolactobacillus sp. THM7-7]|nr:alpha/beta hydrolase [Sporolactobacillus sp. THM7-7]
MPYLPIDDYQLYYNYRCTDQNNPTLLFIHDLSVDLTTWKLLIDELNATFNVLTYDYFGHGRTTASAALISLEQLFREIHALIQTLQLKKLHIIGSGFSGVLAFLYAKHDLRYVQSLIFMSVPFYLPKEMYHKELQSMIRLLLVDRSLFARKIVIENVHPVTDRKAALIMNAVRRISRKNFEHMITILTNQTFSERFSLIPQLGHMKIPCFILHGEFDPLFPANLSVVCATQIPNGRGLIIPEASHLMELDQPRMVAHFLNLFIHARKTVFHSSPVHRKATGELKAILDKGFHELLTLRPSFKMKVMHGETQFFWKGKRVDGKWNQRQAKELILFLILNHGAVKRDQLIDVFFPELPLSQAKSRMRVHLSHLSSIFHRFPNPELRDALVISRDAVVLNTETECDFIDYMEGIDKLQREKTPSAERARRLIQKLKIYNPGWFAAFRGEWMVRFIEKAEQHLFEAMDQLLNELEQEGNTLLQKEILENGAAVEPYDGFCEEKLKNLRLKQDIRKNGRA